MYTIATFYHFFDFHDYAQKRAALLALLKERGIKGSILVAGEGINGTISGTREDIDAVLAYIRRAITGGAFDYKESEAAIQPFGKAKVRLKKETISLGEPVSMRQLGQYVEPKDWNALIDDPETIVLDSRNWYETHLGTFARAIDPNTKNFKELPSFIKEKLADAKQKKIATFCTGGIRCEKLTGWLKDQGYENVYHLRGGILKYLEEIPAQESRWQGECYVFDQRIAVGHGLTPSCTASICRACGNALTESDRSRPEFTQDVSCQFCNKKAR